MTQAEIVGRAEVLARITRKVQFWVRHDTAQAQMRNSEKQYVTVAILTHGSNEFCLVDANADNETRYFVNMINLLWRMPFRRKGSVTRTLWHLAYGMARTASMFSFVSPRAQEKVQQALRSRRAVDPLTVLLAQRIRIKRHRHEG